MTPTEALVFGMDLSNRVGEVRARRNEDRLRKLVGGQIAGGDFQGGAAALLEAGQLEPGMALQEMGRDRQREAGMAALTSLRQLRTMPEADRAMIAPMMAQRLQQFGIDTSQLSFRDLSDATLDREIATLAPHLEGPPSVVDPVTVSAGEHLVDPTTGRAIFSAPFKPDAPSEAARPRIVQGPDGRPYYETGEPVLPGAGAAAAARKIVGRETRTGNVLQAIDLAREQSTPATTGIRGQIGRWLHAANLGGQPSANLAKTIDEIEANIGFAELQAMRDNSPTGGALGSVTERELQLLSSTLASLSQSQSDEQFDANLERVLDQVVASAEQVRAAYIEDFGEEPPDTGLFAAAREIKARFAGVGDDADVDPEIDELLRKYGG